MSNWFHEGEIEIQQRAGVRSIADRVAESIDDRIPPAAVPFLTAQHFALLGAARDDGLVIATTLAGAPGFLQPSDDETHLRINKGLLPHDPLADALNPGRSVGMQVIEPRTRRRMRLNGRIASHGADSIDIDLFEVYSNCPKYIQAREFTPVIRTVGLPAIGTSLTPGQQAQIAAADTFYIATLHAERGADISHRGGMPGFVSVDDNYKLSWPDYNGNNMFQTLGNLHVDPRAGLLFIDTDSGNLLHVSGRASVDWNEAHSSQFPGAQRMIDFEITHVVDRPETFPLSAKLIDYSQYNPRAV
ncbi:MAG: pyridoxamine 5'-phosphate oxidase family protein [Phycisphaerales bacterium]|nr:pyridoxamine 5'-phosphate oxidase family protein [Phycisphaerales bacterium]